MQVCGGRHPFKSLWSPAHSFVTLCSVEHRVYMYRHWVRYSRNGVILILWNTLFLLSLTLCRYGLTSHRHWSRCKERWILYPFSQSSWTWSKLRSKVCPTTFEICNTTGLLRSNTHIAFWPNTFLVSKWRENYAGEM